MQEKLLAGQRPASRVEYIAMSVLLEMPEVRQRLSRLSVAEYHRLGEFNGKGRRTELIRGLVIEKRSKSPLHSAMAKRLYDLIAPMLPAGFVVRHEEPITFADSEPEPDIAIVRGAEADFFQAHPTTAALVVEVAVSSSALDRENATLYAEGGVREYWIVLCPDRRVEVYRQPENGRYRETRLYGSGDLLACASVPTVQIHVSELFGTAAK
jgi:Uma2 family endonuclease